MRMTSTGAFQSALAAARPPKPPPTITTRGLFDVCSSAPLIEFRLESFIHSFLKPLSAEISENLEFFSQTAMVRSAANRRLLARDNNQRGASKGARASCPRSSPSSEPESDQENQDKRSQH